MKLSTVKHIYNEVLNAALTFFMKLSTVKHIYNEVLNASFTFFMKLSTVKHIYNEVLGTRKNVPCCILYNEVQTN